MNDNKSNLALLQKILNATGAIAIVLGLLVLADRLPIHIPGPQVFGGAFLLVGLGDLLGAWWLGRKIDH